MSHNKIFLITDKNNKNIVPKILKHLEQEKRHLQGLTLFNHYGGNVKSIVDLFSNEGHARFDRQPHLTIFEEITCLKEKIKQGVKMHTNVFVICPVKNKYAIKNFIENEFPNSLQPLPVS